MFDAAELGVSVGDHRGNPGRIHHVGRDAQRLPAALANALANLCVTLRQDVGNDKIGAKVRRSEEHTSELQSLMRISYAVFCLNKNKEPYTDKQQHQQRTINNTNTI